MILLLPALASTLVMPGLFAQDAQSAAPAAAPDSFVWLDSDGNPLPFRSVEEMEDFLRTAEVVSSRELGEGITRPKKILLEKDGIRMNAIFRSVDIFRRKWKSQSGDKINFRDFYGFECAAYELSKLLGMQNYPPAVLKTIEGTKGSVQAWVEQAMTEEKRIAQGIQPQNSRIWLYQIELMNLFDNLIYNDDRNQGNILITPDWKMWLIDATRAFRTVPYLRNPEKVRFCDRRVWEKLQGLDENTLKTALRDTELLSDGEFRTLLNRRKKLIEHVEKLIKKDGEGGILYQF